MNRNLSSTSNPDLKEFSESSIIAGWFRLAFKRKMAVALWRLPGNSEKHLIIDTSEELSKGRIDLEETRPGFLFAPFNNQEGKENVLIKAHIHYCTQTDQLVFAEHIHQKGLPMILDQLQQELISPTNTSPIHQEEKPSRSTTKDEFTYMVAEALKLIKSGYIQKVVPSATRQVTLEKGFDSLQVFDKLCASYPNAFVSLVTAPGLGSWMGASPEPIIEVIDGKSFSTAALAGTQAYFKGTSLPEVAWRQKEIEEQALVSRYIINCFKKIRLREFEEVGPKTVVAGNLLHLKTTYTVDMEATNFPQLGSVMLDLLHPTSAVCGMPKAPSMEFLEKQEGFDRSFYSGYLGPVNINHETHLFVNLRCMHIGPQHATLYAGAGVTEDSIPEKEWIETQLKCDTLIEVLNQ